MYPGAGEKVQLYIITYYGVLRVLMAFIETETWMIVRMDTSDHVLSVAVIW